jgi:hypothetical protein
MTSRHYATLAALVTDEPEAAHCLDLPGGVNLHRPADGRMIVRRTTSSARD